MRKPRALALGLAARRWMLGASRAADNTRAEVDSR